jgi:hypothetical protein
MLERRKVRNAHLNIHCCVFSQLRLTIMAIAVISSSATTSFGFSTGGFVLRRPEWFASRQTPFRGYNKIQGALAALGYKLSDTAIGNILKEHGISHKAHMSRGLHKQSG